MGSKLISIGAALGLAVLSSPGLPALAEPADVTVVLDFDSLPDQLELSDFSALTGLDEERLQLICRQLQEQFTGNYVLELASLRELATGLLPLMEQHDETKPYAAWLRARLDYLEVADRLLVSVSAPDNGAVTLSPLPNPAPELERTAWKEHLQAAPASDRSRDFADRLKPIFLEERVPTQLVWLAEVESRFNPTARSPVGAAGLFQIMPLTAIDIGLQLKPDDQRLDPEKSARAAARYLRYLYGRFDDWRLSLAAYNAGETRVQRLLDQHNGRDFDDIATFLPAETQMYVPKVEATLLKREGVALANLGGIPPTP